MSHWHEDEVEQQWYVAQSLTMVDQQPQHSDSVWNSVQKLKAYETKYTARNRSNEATFWTYTYGHLTGGNHKPKWPV